MWPYSRSRLTDDFTDEVSAPIFYRDVPLMPSAGVNGVVSPLAPTSIPLIHWRIRDIREAESHTVLKDMPTCGNCHSFCADGKTFGMDIDGPANDKGLYAVVPVQKHMNIASKDLVHWNRRWKGGHDAGWIHVAGFAGRTLRGEHIRRAEREAAGQLLCDQLSGLSIPPGVLSDAGNSGMV